MQPPGPRLGTLELLLVVDLRALEAPGEVDVDRLPLGVRIEGGMAGLAMAVAGLLPAAEREVRLGAGRPRVDVDDPGLEITHRAEGGIGIAGEDRRAQAVAGLVDGCRGFFV